MRLLIIILHLFLVLTVSARQSAYGTIEQVTHYYPFGAPYSDSSVTSPDLQPYKYNAKEFDTTHKLFTYDYGARQYDPLLAVWHGVDPLCEKDYATGAHVYCRNNPALMIDKGGREPGQFFYTMDAAAEDFGKFYNDNSIRANREYASFGIKVKNAQGVPGYTYTIAKIGTSESSMPAKEYGIVEYAATLHTHGNYIPRLKEGNDVFSGVFDENGHIVKDLKTVNTPGTDIGNANARQLKSYVATPNGSLQKYNPETGKIKVVSNQMASDFNDPDRMNVIAPIEQNPITIDKALNMQKNIEELKQNLWIRKEQH